MGIQAISNESRSANISVKGAEKSDKGLETAQVKRREAPETSEVRRDGEAKEAAAARRESGKGGRIDVPA